MEFSMAPLSNWYEILLAKGHGNPGTIQHLLGPWCSQLSRLLHQDLPTLPTQTGQTNLPPWHYLQSNHATRVCWNTSNQHSEAWTQSARAQLIEPVKPLAKTANRQSASQQNSHSNAQLTIANHSHSLTSTTARARLQALTALHYSSLIK